MTDHTAKARELAVEIRELLPPLLRPSTPLEDGLVQQVLIKALREAAAVEREAGRLQGLREAASAVHCLRPSEHEMPGGKYAQMLAYPHVLKQWAADRDAVGDLIPADWRERLRGEVAK